MIIDRFINYQADDKAWAARFKKRDEDAAKRLEEQLAEGRKKHPGPQTVIYQPPEPETPPPAGTVKAKPVRQTGSTSVAHISEALDKKHDEES